MITKQELQEMAAKFPRIGDWVVVSLHKDTQVPGGRGPLFWRPNERGYTDCLLSAGVHPEKEAKSICKGSRREVRAYRIGMNKRFLLMLQSFGFHILPELAAIYELERRKA